MALKEKDFPAAPAIKAPLMSISAPLLSSSQCGSRRLLRWIFWGGLYRHSVSVSLLGLQTLAHCCHLLAAALLHYTTHRLSWHHPAVTFTHAGNRMNIQRRDNQHLLNNEAQSTMQQQNMSVYFYEIPTSEMMSQLTSPERFVLRCLTHRAESI